MFLLMFSYVCSVSSHVSCFLDVLIFVLFCLIFVVESIHKVMFLFGLFQFSFHAYMFSFSFGLSSLFSILFCHVPSHFPVFWFSSSFPFVFETTFRRGQV